MLLRSGSCRIITRKKHRETSECGCCFLKGTELNWFDNHEEELNFWDAFTAKFSDVHGKPECLKQQARETLSRLCQTLGETSTRYIEEVQRLGRRVEPDVTESDKVRHLHKRLSHDDSSVIPPTSPGYSATPNRRMHEQRHHSKFKRS